MSPEIDYVTIASEGNAIDFGDPTFNSFSKTAFSSSTRGIWGGGWDGSSANVNTIEYIQFSTLVAAQEVYGEEVGLVLLIVMLLNTFSFQR